MQDNDSYYYSLGLKPESLILYPFTQLHLKVWVEYIQFPKITKHYWNCNFSLFRLRKLIFLWNFESNLIIYAIFHSSSLKVLWWHINWSQLNCLNISTVYPRMKDIKREKNLTITNDMCFSSLPVLTNCYDSPTYSLNIAIHKLSVPTIPSTIIILYRSIPFCFPSLFLDLYNNIH